MQPDFSAFFRSDVVEPLRFEVRGGPNFVHDVQFLSGYLDGARFTTEDVRVDGDGKLTIAFDRDCWELGYTEYYGTMELHTANSELTVEPVSDVQWERANETHTPKELAVENIYMGESHWDKDNASELIISAPHSGWKMRIIIADDFASIRLDDLETPHLHSAQADEDAGEED